MMLEGAGSSTALLQLSVARSWCGRRSCREGLHRGGELSVSAIHSYRPFDGWSSLYDDCRELLRWFDVAAIIVRTLQPKPRPSQREIPITSRRVRKAMTAQHTDEGLAKGSLKLVEQAQMIVAVVGGRCRGGRQEVPAAYAVTRSDGGTRLLPLHKSSDVYEKAQESRHAQHRDE